MRTELIDIAVDGAALSGTLAAPATTLPGVLFVHGWGGSQQSDLELARGIAALGCVCLSFDLRGHARDEARRGEVTRGDNLADVLAAYDRLCAHPEVASESIAVVGSSYGGYLASLLTQERAVRWLALRVPALYRDREWDTPKLSLDRRDLAVYRGAPVAPEDNLALRAAAAFEGDVLLVESAHDHLIPHATIASWMGAFRCARSLTYRRIADADHALSTPAHRAAWRKLLVAWASEMVLGAR